jgi:hypothetical protein
MVMVRKRRRNGVGDSVLDVPVLRIHIRALLKKNANNPSLDGYLLQGAVSIRIETRKEKKRNRLEKHT